MRILFIDSDDQRFNQYTASAREGAEVSRVKTYREARLALEAGEYDLVLIDHDLDKEGMAEGITVSPGVALAYVAASCADRLRDTRFVIHSMNDMEAMFMHMVFRQAGLAAVRIPAAWTKTFGLGR